MFYTVTFSACGIVHCQPVLPESRREGRLIQSWRKLQRMFGNSCTFHRYWQSL